MYFGATSGAFAPVLSAPPPDGPPAPDLSVARGCGGSLSSFWPAPSAFPTPAGCGFNGSASRFARVFSAILVGRTPPAPGPPPGSPPDRTDVTVGGPPPGGKLLRIGEGPRPGGRRRRTWRRPSTEGMEGATPFLARDPSRVLLGIPPGHRGKR